MTQEVKNKVQYIDISTLEELERNPRKISASDFEALKRSITKDPCFFECRPLIVNKVNSKNIVIAGNQRLKASKELGLKEVPCVVFHNLSKEQQRRITIKDNHNNGFWDFDILSADFKDFDFEDIGMIVNFNYDIDIKQNEPITNIQQELPNKTNADVMATREICCEKAEEDNINACNVNYQNEISKKHKCPKCGYEFEE